MDQGTQIGEHRGAAGAELEMESVDVAGIPPCRAGTRTRAEMGLSRIAISV